MTAPDGREKLRLGILLDSYQVPAWVHAMLERIHPSDYAAIGLVVLNDSAGREASIVQPPRPGYRHLLYNSYRKLDDRLFRPQPDALARRDLGDLLAGVSCLRVIPQRSAQSHRFDAADVRRIAEQDLDVLIQIGFCTLVGDILRSARLGVWAFQYGDRPARRGGPPGFWEVMDGHLITRSTLQIRDEESGAGSALSSSISATDRWSVKRNCNGIYWKNSAMLPRTLRALHRQGPESFLAERRSPVDVPRPATRSMRGEPGNWECAPALCRHLARFLWHRAYYLFLYHQWNLLYDIGGGPETLLDDPSLGSASPFRRYRRLAPPKDRFWADPHVVFRDGSYFVFFEEVLYSTRRGRIAVLTVDPTGRTGRPRTVLEPDYHVSYPFVFEWQDQTYMLLESSAVRRIQIFQCEEFPHRWAFRQNLIEDVAAVDGTLCHHEGRWWLFANVREQEGTSFNDELFVFHAESPLSRVWTPHPRNPIVSDARRARPAGPLFRHQGALYRPSQDCSGSYGRGLVLNRVAVLTDTDYQEEEVLRWGPDWHWNVRGLHTLAHEGRLNVIDAKLRRFRLF